MNKEGLSSVAFPINAHNILIINIFKEQDDS